MSNNFLFALEATTEEVLISESPKGSNQINFIERIKRKENEILYNAVVTLTNITQSSDFDAGLFKAMDKVCQMAYNKHNSGK